MPVDERFTRSPARRPPTLASAGSPGSDEAEFPARPAARPGRATSRRHHPYPLIADHGLLGDFQTSALVATDGTIDSFCAPRFDSPSLFGALLDHERGGHFRVRPTAEVFTSKQLYVPDTAAGRGGVAHRRPGHDGLDRRRRTHAGLQGRRHSLGPANLTRGPEGPARTRARRDTRCSLVWCDPARGVLSRRQAGQWARTDVDGGTGMPGAARWQRPAGTCSVVEKLLSCHGVGQLPTGHRQCRIQLAGAGDHAQRVRRILKPARDLRTATGHRMTSERLAPPDQLPQKRRMCHHRHGHLQCKPIGPSNTSLQRSQPSARFAP